MIILDDKESPEEKAKVKASEEMRRAKIELASFEGELTILQCPRVLRSPTEDEQTVHRDGWQVHGAYRSW